MAGADEHGVARLRAAMTRTGAFQAPGRQNAARPRHGACKTPLRFSLAINVHVNSFVNHVPRDSFLRSCHRFPSDTEPPWPPEVEQEYHRKFSGRFERWLDRGYGDCLLRDRDHASIVADAIRHFEGERSLLHAWVVMPNHVHVLCSLANDMSLGSLLHSWKGFSARQINLRLGASGSIWQKSYFDRIVRDWDHFANCARYIRNNPAKAKLTVGAYLHGESDVVRKMLGVAASGPP